MPDPDALANKIVYYQGKLFGRPYVRGPRPPQNGQRLTQEDMSQFPWEKVVGTGFFAACNPMNEDISYHIPLSRLSDKKPNVDYIHFDRFYYHDAKAVQFARGRLSRTGSLVSKLSREIVGKIIALVLADNYWTP